jgi:hypothetical protein
MKRTTKIMSWALVSTALMWTACGGRDESSYQKHLKPGTGTPPVTTEKMDPNEPASDTKLAGIWLGPTDTKSSIHQINYWEINTDRTTLTIKAICSSGSSEVTASLPLTITATSHHIQINGIGDSSNASRPINDGNNKGTCKINPPQLKQVLRYNLSDSGILQVTDSNNHPLQPDMYRAIMKDNKPIRDPSTGTNGATDTTTADAAATTARLAEIMASLPTEVAAAIKNEGTLKDEIKAVRWHRKGVVPTGKEIGSYYIMDLAADKFTLSKVCYIGGGKPDTTQAKVTVKAITSGKAIRILEAKEATSDKLNCSVKVDVQTSTYTMDTEKNTLTLKTEALTEDYTPLSDVLTP